MFHQKLPSDTIFPTPSPIGSIYDIIFHLTNQQVILVEVTKLRTNSSQSSEKAMPYNLFQKRGFTKSSTNIMYTVKMDWGIW